MVYNPDFLTYSLSSHVQSLSWKPELYTIWKYFKNFYFLQYFPKHWEWFSISISISIKSKSKEAQRACKALSLQILVLIRSKTDFKQN